MTCARCALAVVVELFFNGEEGAAYLDWGLAEVVAEVAWWLEI